MKKILAAVLAAAMSLGMASVAFADFSGSLGNGTVTGSSVDTTEYVDFNAIKDKSTFVVVTAEGKDILYQYDFGSIELKFLVDTGYTLAVHVTEGPVMAPCKRMEMPDGRTGYTMTVKSDIAPTDLKTHSWCIEVELMGPDGVDKTCRIKGKVAYSGTQTVEPGDRLRVTPSRPADTEGDTGSIFAFSGPLTETARVRCSDELDLYFQGDYGDMKVNLRVVKDAIPEVEKLFDGARLDFQSFVAPARFAIPVTVKLGGDIDVESNFTNANSYLYAYDAASGELTRVDAQYENYNWTFTTGYLTTFILSDKEAAVSEPDTPTVPDDDNDDNEGEVRDTVERQAASNNASDNSRANVRGVTRLTQEALRAAGDVGNAAVRMTNVNVIGRDALQAAQQTAAGQKVVFHFDQAKKGVVESRLYIDPAQLSGNGEERVSLKVTLNEKKVKQAFERYYQNELQTISFSQKGGFGGPVEVAARLDLNGMDTKALRFYHYDAASNSFYLLPAMRYFVDTNGYLHVQGLVNTDSLIVTDRPLARR